jgi:prephenate dehydrogenase
MHKIAIIGLGQIGASIGLGLRSKIKGIEITGHDIEPTTAGKARKIGAVDKISYSLPKSLEGASIVIICVPVEAVKQIFEEIATSLEEGTIVTDTSSTKIQVMQWAEEILPKTVDFIGGHPMAGVETPGIDGAEEGLFEGATYGIFPPVDVRPESIDAIVSLISILKAKPLFIDPVEHDSLVAGVSHLPIALSINLINATTQSPSWREMSRLAAGSFRDVSRLASGSVDMHHSIFSTNRDSILRWLDSFDIHLKEFRKAVEEGGDDLRDLLETAYQSRSDWLSGKVESDNSMDNVPTASENMLGMLGGDKLAQLSRKFDKDSKDKPLGR